jgi:hypothetical protein
MIQKDSVVVLRTKEAVYSTCKIVSMGKENITIKYFTGMQKDNQTGQMRGDHRVETISRKNIVDISERC